MIVQMTLKAIKLQSFLR